MKGDMMIGVGMPEIMVLGITIGTIVGCLFIYFLPTIIAIMRKHNNRMPIFILNLLLGWSMIAWIIALVWSLTKDVEGQNQKEVVNENS
jgi:hypothetical protein